MSDSVVTAHQVVSPYFLKNCTILTISAFIYTVHYLHSVGMIIHVEPSGEAMQRGTKQHRGERSNAEGRIISEHGTLLFSSTGDYYATERIPFLVTFHYISDES